MLLAMARIAYDAGEIILRHYAEEIVSHHKEDHSPVTAADVEAEKYILSRLHHLVPGVPIIAEEEVAAGRVPKANGRFFLVDPLDGTKEFISRNGEFTVNIAEIENGKPVRGVVYLPAKERLFAGETPGSAFAMETRAGEQPDFSQLTLIHVRPAPEDGLVAVASRSHRDYNTDEYLKNFPIKDFAAAGSSLKLCLVAAGEADIYPRLGRTMEWDIAAGHAVLAAAGGTVTTIDGRPFTYGKVEEKFANPFFVARGR